MKKRWKIENSSGILTNRDMRFITDMSGQIQDVMTKENLVTAPVGTSLEEAELLS